MKVPVSRHQFESYLPGALQGIRVTDTLIPQIAKDRLLLTEIDEAVQTIPTTHHLHHCDARQMTFLKPNSIHLVLTSPPYWTLKRYRDGDGQLGHIAGYEEFLDSLDSVWKQCLAALVPGGRLICVVGDVCLSRRKNNGRHTVVPLHASIQERCRQLGFDNLAPIFWHKISNAAYEVEGGGGFLGKPYEPNAVIKNDVEFILMERKPGGYRSPTPAVRLLSIIPDARHKVWFQQIWSDIPGASTRDHPAPYPVELAERLIRMFSFVGDVVLDPFMGTGTTAVAAHRCGRHSAGVEVDSEYFEKACSRVYADTRDLFDRTEIRLFPKNEPAPHACVAGN